MDNTKLLRMIGTTLGTLAGKIDTALAESRPPCEVPCATGHCADNTAGVCTGPETCARGFIMPLAADGAITPCNEPCGHSGCTHTLGGLCTSAETCHVHVPAEKSGPCYRHACIQQGEQSVCYAVSFCENRIPEELLQDYTLAQWDEIRKGGYLCEFSNVTNDGGPDWENPVVKLVEIGRKWGNGRTDIIFTSESGKEYAFCRPAQIPGVLRPWFGGDCPVDPRAVVLIKMRVGRVETVKGAAYVVWGHNGAMAAESEVIAYMEV